MSQTRSVHEDSFEKARRAFFGKANVASKASAPQACAITLHPEPVRETAAQPTAGMASSKRAAARSMALVGA